MKKQLINGALRTLKALNGVKEDFTTTFSDQSVISRRSTVLVTLLLVGSVSVFATSAFVTTAMSIFDDYVKPALLVFCFILIVIGGLQRTEDFQAGGGAAKEAFFAVIKMALYPLYVLGIAEAVKTYYGF